MRAIGRWVVLGMSTVIMTGVIGLSPSGSAAAEKGDFDGAQRCTNSTPEGALEDYSVYPDGVYL